MAKKRIDGEAELLTLPRHDVNRIVQEKRSDFARWLSHENARVRLVSHQDRKRPDVILMGMTDKNGVDRSAFDGLPVGERVLAYFFWMHSTIQNQSLVIGFKVVRVRADFGAAGEIDKLHACQLFRTFSTSHWATTTPTPIPQYQGELISMDIKDYDIKDFLRLISEISGLNVVLDPSINGSVTQKLTDVPWDQALDVVLKNYNLGGQLQGNVLRIATNGTLQQEQAAQKALRDAQELATPLTTRTFTLNYTKAEAISTILRSLLTTRGSIIQDPRRNALIITDIPTQFSNLETMVRDQISGAQSMTNSRPAGTQVVARMFNRRDRLRSRSRVALQISR